MSDDDESWPTHHRRARDARDKLSADAILEIHERGALEKFEALKNELAAYAVQNLTPDAWEDGDLLQAKEALREQVRSGGRVAKHNAVELARKARCAAVVTLPAVWLCIFGAPWWASLLSAVVVLARVNLTGKSLPRLITAKLLLWFAAALVWALLAYNLWRWLHELS